MSDTASATENQDPAEIIAEVMYRPCLWGREAAREIIDALAEAGYVIVPREAS